MVAWRDGCASEASERGLMIKDEGYNGWFYFFLLMGIIGMLGFLAVAVSAAGGI